MFHSPIDRNTTVPTPAPAVVRPERRGNYDKLLEVAGVSAEQILKLFRDCLPPRVIMSLGSSGFTAVSLDLYGYCPTEGVAVVQIRQVVKPKSNSRYVQVRKSYVLVGKGEITGEPFCHGVSANAVRAAIRKHKNDHDCARQVIWAAQRWIFQLTESQHQKSVRQGDVIMFPATKPKQQIGLVAGPVLIGGSHQLRAAEIIEIEAGSDYIARDPALWHLKFQHDPTYAPQDGWFRVRQARAEATWDFAQQFGD